MRSLEQALEDRELLVLRVLGEWWELDLSGANKQAAIKALAQRLAKVDLQQELQFLQQEEAAALQALAEQGGRMPVAAFTRAYGEVRLMGPGRMEREEPWYEPVSAAEALWYRGFLYRGFDETDEGVLEFYYLPTELQAQFPQVEMAAPKNSPTAVAALTPVPTAASVQTAVADAVDDLTTLLALALKTSLRSEALDRLDDLLLNPERQRRSLLLTLAEEMGLVRRDEAGIRPTRAAVDWLKLTREGQSRALAEAWTSSAWNDLCHTPGLVCEGEGWSNDPLLARTALLDVLPRDTQWYAVADVVALLKTTHPDFQRPDGNYDTWYIREATQDAYLTGFESWDAVEGRLLLFLLQGPLFWLGMADTAVDPQAERVLYRLTQRALDWLEGAPLPDDEVRLPLVVQPNGRLVVPHEAGRYARFRAARVAEPQPVQPGNPFTYLLTPRSLQEAREQGIKPQRLLAFLAEASERPVPKSVERAILRWEAHGVEGRLETAVILRVKNADILETLRQNPKTRDYLGESLGDLAVVVRPGKWRAFSAATAQLGLLLDVDVPG